MLKLRTYSTDSNATQFIESFSQIPTLVRAKPYHFGQPPAQLWAFMVTTPYPKPKEFWIIEDAKGKPIARAGAALSITRPGVGYVGFFEIEVQHPDAHLATQLIDQTATQWLKTLGAHEVYGPMNYSTWFQHRLRTNYGSDDWLFGFEPHHPPEYVQAFLSMGYASCGQWMSQGMSEFAELMEHSRKKYDSNISQGFQFKGFSEFDYDRELIPALHELSLLVFKDNFLYEPIDLAGVRALYSGMKGEKLTPANVVVSPDGKIAGFCIFFIENDHLVYKTAAVHPEYRGTGISTAYIYACAARAQFKFKHYASAMFKSDNLSNTYTKHGTTSWTHHYELYSKSI